MRFSDLAIRSRFFLPIVTLAADVIDSGRTLGGVALEDIYMKVSETEFVRPQAPTAREPWPWLGNIGFDKVVPVTALEYEAKREAERNLEIE